MRKNLFSPLFIVAMIIFAVTVHAATPEEILKKIDGIISSRAAGWCKDKISYPPDCVVIRIFKAEGRAEIWAKDAGMEETVLITELDVCSMDFKPGPKLREGDGKTPEGFYNAEFAYQSSSWWMWIDLDKPKDRGITGRGSCFKIDIEYPNALDVKRTREAGGGRPGGEIRLHGNCVTAGCISFLNLDFLPVFAFARHHAETRYGKVQIQIFPFRFETADERKRREYAEEYCHKKAFGIEKLLRFWKGLEVGYTMFNHTHMPLKTDLSGKRIKDGYASNAVTDIKTFLLSRGYFSGIADEMASSGLREAVKRFQERNSLASDGVIGPATLSKMRSLGLEAVIEYQFKY